MKYTVFRGFQEKFVYLEFYKTSFLDVMIGLFMVSDYVENL